MEAGGVRRRTEMERAADRLVRILKRRRKSIGFWVVTWVSGSTASGPVKS